MLSKLIIISTMIVLNTVSTVNGQNQTDIKGWRMAEWDMSRGDLIEAFKGEISQIESNTLVIEKFTISEYSFDVEFLMNEKTSLLEGVVFRYNLKSENYKWLEYKSAFNFLEKSLIEKYGKKFGGHYDVRAGGRGGCIALNRGAVIHCLAR